MTPGAKHIIVHGRVQGVGFRYFVRNTAARLGLTGNVHNCPDSTVEIMVEGDPRAVETFIDEVKKGPALARVGHVVVEDMPVRCACESFTIEGW